MIINSRIYCNYFVPNRAFYLTVKNNGNLLIQVILQYTVSGGTITRNSGILSSTELTRLYIHEGATDIYFNILNESFQERPLIYHGHIPVSQSTCYKITGTPQNPICTNTPC